MLASVPMLCFSIRLISSDSERCVGGVVILSFTSNVANLPLDGDTEILLSDWSTGQNRMIETGINYQNGQTNYG